MTFNLKQNDTSPSILVTLQDALRNPINITGATVRLYMKSVDGFLKIDAPMTINDALGGVCQYDWQAGDTDTVGTYYIEFEVTYSDLSVETFPNNGSEAVKVVRSLN